ncbi:hypothetical protein [Oryzibacter oryziterrae]|uniref:hypothetical protein n=1 Tax=Oryzibacter oryziterrae TaxID=2766474 RepID=UPI001F243EA0|nr:hypothetical protein [Oryzibacter oryziterrae]
MSSLNSASSSAAPTLRSSGLPAFVLAVLAVAFYVTRPTKDDISWLIVTAEALWDGKRLYVDIIETNPPLSVLLYLPAVALERLFGLRAEIGTILMTALIGWGVTSAATRRLAAAGLLASPLAFELAAAVIFIWLPLGAFGQKDHVAAMIALPFLCDLAVMAEGHRKGERRIPWVWTGVLAGLAVAIKPQFGLAVALPSLVLCLVDRNWRLLINRASIAAGCTFVAFQAMVYAFFPAFFHDVLPMLLGLYAPMRQDLKTLVIADMGMMVPILLVIAGLALGRGSRQPLPIALMLAAVGFFAAFLIQGKGWPYQLYPALAYAFLPGLGLALPALWRLDRPRSRTVGLTVALALILGARWMTLTWIDYSDLTAAIRATGIATPRILNIAASHGIGHPSTRDAGGIWVGTLMSRLISVQVMNTRSSRPPEQRDDALLDHWEAYDRASLRSDLATRAPDMLLIERGPDFDWLAWARQDAETARLLDGFVFASRVPDHEADGFVELFVRKADKPAG